VLAWHTGIDVLFPFIKRLLLRLLFAHLRFRAECPHVFFSGQLSLAFRGNALHCRAEGYMK